MPNTSSPLISPDVLMDRLSLQPQLVVLDCSFDLAQPGACEAAFAQGHLPGARYVHLERELSAPKSARGPIEGGRHPLPTREVFAQTAAAWGVTPAVEVVAYDSQGGAYAARAWWMLRWLGHGAVRVLDGGLPAWVAQGGPLATGPGPEPVPAPPYPLREAGMRTVDAQQILNGLGVLTVLDARAPERFRGDVEPLDTQAGHIPGARHRFFRDNLQPDGRFRPAPQLRDAFVALGVRPDQLVHQCGSGVTACHNLLAMAVAGLHGSALYPGSWSEWSADPARPVAKA